MLKVPKNIISRPAKRATIIPKLKMRFLKTLSFLSSGMRVQKIPEHALDRAINCDIFLNHHDPSILKRVQGGKIMCKTCGCTHCKCGAKIVNGVCEGCKKPYNDCTCKKPKK